jgi:hypothetical protein
MAYLKELYDNKSLHLDDLCKLLTKEIDELATAEYKLKLVFVLVHIINESKKALGEINIGNCLKDLQKLVEEACKQTEKQKEVQKLRFDQDKDVRDIIDGSNSELLALDREIEPLLTRYESILNTLVKIRESMSLPEREVVQNQSI